VWYVYVTDMERLPLQVLIGPGEEAVSYEDEFIAGLTDFELDANTHVHTVFSCANCFPRRSGHRIPSISKEYPLRIYVGDDVNEIVVSYDGMQLSHLGPLYVVLGATRKRIVRITSYVPLPDYLNTALLDLGVEVIVQPPDVPTAGDADARL
jgi:hypothetical protein